MSDETQPLLSSETREVAEIEVPGPIVIDNQLEWENPPVGSFVTCRVCQAQIDISGQRNQHVIKCGACNEATPIRIPPPGKKYVRCPCKCLLICRSTSQRIACPRSTCKRILNLSPSSSSQRPPEGMVRITCTHCRDTFLFSEVVAALGRCPHCRKLSSIGIAFGRRKGTISLALGILILMLGSIFLMTIRLSPGIIVLVVALFTATALFLIRSIYYFTMKVSIAEISV